MSASGPRSTIMFSEYVSKAELVFVLIQPSLSGQMTVRSICGTYNFRLASQFLTAMHKEALIDNYSGRTLFKLRKKHALSETYYAEHPERHDQLFQVKKQSSLLQKPSYVATIANQAEKSPDGEFMQVHFEPHGMFGLDGSFHSRGLTVATLAQTQRFWKKKYRLAVAPGSDPTLIIGIVMVLFTQAASGLRS